MNEKIASKPTSTGINELKALEISYIRATSKFGLTSKLAPFQVYNHLQNSPAALIAAVSREVSDLISIFETCSKENINPWDDKEFLRLSMRALGYNYPPDFLDNVADGDLIEGYDMERRQIFRNLAFMEHSGYSLVEMLSFEWPTLFDRSKVITQKMMSFCDEILWTENRTIPFVIPHHYLRERQSSERLMWEVEFRHLAPLFSGPNKPAGLLGSCRVKAIDRTSPVERLTFL